MEPSLDELKQAVADYKRKLHARGHIVALAGNVSTRIPDTNHVLVTPSQVPIDALGAADVVTISVDGDFVDGNRPPSSEARVHAAIYRARPDVGAVIHGHSPYATALAVLGRPIEPIMDEFLPYVGGTVEVAPFGMSGSAELIEGTVEALGPRAAVLLRHHGQVAVGKNLDKAFQVAELVEWAARVTWLATVAGRPERLPPEAIETSSGVYAYVKDM
ncbi:MAG: class II aldolase/adducin family protein [Deltaproteobacteria bacterium]|nr:class II aldolase/adducin family protein [Deltaproteobacteria bacterium]